ncbi:MAG: hypothetical protein Q4D51_02255 [Eubacteriales bacterium]|nr:hypothetical protein [Eubacteriales bacterium]
MCEIVRTTLNSKRNGVAYTLYENKVVISTGKGEVTIPLPYDDNYECFDHILYMGEKLYAIVACRVGFDVKYVIDEENFTLKDCSPFK